MASTKFISALLIGSLFGVTAQAKVQKWVDNQGITHYSEVIPAEFADKDHAELSKSGRVVNKTDVLTPEERRAKEAADAKQRAEDEAVREQKLHDSTLLKTYTSVDELELDRQRSLERIDLRVRAKSRQISDVNNYLDDLQKAAFVKTEAGKPVPQDLLDDIQSTQLLLNKYHKELAQINIEKAALEARFDSDRARYKELTRANQ